MKALVVLAVFVGAVVLLVLALRRRAPITATIKPASAPPPPPLAVAPVAPPESVAQRVEVEVSLPGLKIVGESHYQEALEEIVGGRTDESADFEVDVSLVPESDNEYDPNAVGVEIDGELVGYLSRASAKKYRAKFGALTTQEWPARITGGWDRGGGDRGSFGVRLEE